MIAPPVSMFVPLAAVGCVTLDYWSGTPEAFPGRALPDGRPPTIIATASLPETSRRWDALSKSSPGFRYLLAALAYVGGRR
jgi:hypothetical protein